MTILLRHDQPRRCGCEFCGFANSYSADYACAERASGLARSNWPAQYLAYARASAALMSVGIRIINLLRYMYRGQGLLGRQVTRQIWVVDCNFPQKHSLPQRPWVAPTFQCSESLPIRVGCIGQRTGYLIGGDRPSLITYPRCMSAFRAAISRDPGTLDLARSI
jgi:hypothetical protein